MKIFIMGNINYVAQFMKVFYNVTNKWIACVRPFLLVIYYTILKMKKILASL